MPLGSHIGPQHIFGSKVREERMLLESLFCDFICFISNLHREKDQLEIRIDIGNSDGYILELQLCYMGSNVDPRQFLKEYTLI